MALAAGSRSRRFPARRLSPWFMLPHQNAETALDMTTAPTPSLLRRITIRLILVTASTIVLSYVWIYYQLQFASDRVAEGSLISQAQDLVSGLKIQDGRVVLQMPSELAGSKAEVDGLFRYSVTDSLGKTLIHSQWPTTPVEKIRILDPTNQLYQVQHQVPASEGYYGVVVNTSIGRQRLIVQVERNSRGTETLMDTILEEFFIHGAWMAAPFLVVLLGITFWTIRGAIAPLHELSKQAAAIGPTTTDRRLTERGVPREILPLVQAVNSALDRLEAGFRVQREFTADAAHELRTPLAVLCAHIDTLPDRKLALSLREDVDPMTHVVSQLLKVANLDSLSIGSEETAELGELVISVAKRIIPLAVEQGSWVDAQIGTQPLLVHGNRESIYNAIRNLAENALRHTKTKSIELLVGNDLSVSIVDHGPGIPPEQREQIFQRFWRAQRHRTGAGLGLAIVKKTMDLHGGTVSVGDTPGGGATFTLRFRPPFSAAPPPTGAKPLDRPIPERAAV